MYDVTKRINPELTDHDHVLMAYHQGRVEAALLNTRPY